MKVTLLNCTPDALSLLLRTKNTRLGFNSDPATWPEDKRAEHLAYMKDTIKSSWEFVDYVFEIEGVTRAFTHQLVRTRTGSYAQESQRTVDVRDNEVLKPQSQTDRAPGSIDSWDVAVEKVLHSYEEMIDSGIPVQDARGILPTNMTTSIVAKFNLRTLHEMAKVRMCVRTQGEYQDVFRHMRAEVIKVHPWVSDFKFIEVNCVATGTCAFPRYGKVSCHIYDPRMDLSAVQTDTYKRFWLKEKQVAVPVAKDGKTM
jgi:flavin-dependent thymidylate synthase